MRWRCWPSCSAAAPPAASIAAWWWSSRSPAGAGSGYCGDSLDLGTFSLYAVPPHRAAAMRASRAGHGRGDRPPAARRRDRGRGGGGRRRRCRPTRSRRATASSGPARVVGAALATGSTIEDIEAWPDRIAAVTVADSQGRRARRASHQLLGHRHPAAEGGWVMGDERHDRQKSFPASRESGIRAPLRRSPAAAFTGVTGVRSQPGAVLRVSPILPWPSRRAARARHRRAGGDQPRRDQGLADRGSQHPADRRRHRLPRRLGARSRGQGRADERSSPPASGRGRGRSRFARVPAAAQRSLHRCRFDAGMDEFTGGHAHPDARVATRPSTCCGWR